MIFFFINFLILQGYYFHTFLPGSHHFVYRTWPSHWAYHQQINPQDIHLKWELTYHDRVYYHVRTHPHIWSNNRWGSSSYGKEITLLIIEALHWKVIHIHWIVNPTILHHKLDSFFCNKELLFHLFYRFGSIPHSMLHHCRWVFHNLISIHSCSFPHIWLHLHILLINKSNWLLFSSSLQLLFQLQLMTNLKLGLSSDLLISKVNVL